MKDVLDFLFPSSQPFEVISSFLLRKSIKKYYGVVKNFFMKTKIFSFVFA